MATCAATALDKVTKEQLTFPNGSLITAIMKINGCAPSSYYALSTMLRM